MAPAPAMRPGDLGRRPSVPVFAMLAACGVALAWLALLPAQTRRLDAGRPGDARVVDGAHAQEPPVSIEVDYARGVQADFAAIVPGAERVGDRTVRYRSDDPLVAYRGFLAGNRLAGAID